MYLSISNCKGGFRDRDFVTKISIIITDAVNFDLETKNGKFPLLFYVYTKKVTVFKPRKT